MAIHACLLMCVASFYSVIGDVRGRGLMLGMELVTDRTTKAPATDETLQVFEKMKGEPPVRVPMSGFFFQKR
jgi:alanine-glyoxylate transaminase/(R)-3-amino-2-methylpropionate-pyruvate transaminase